MAAEDEIIVLAAPDPQGADDAIRISGRECGGVGCGLRAAAGTFVGALTSPFLEGALRIGCRNPACPVARFAVQPAAPACTALHGHQCTPQPDCLLYAELAEGQAMVMFNPRLASGDVGVGLSVSACGTGLGKHILAAGFLAEQHEHCSAGVRHGGVPAYNVC